MTVKTISAPSAAPPHGTTGTGLDSLVAAIGEDAGLRATLAPSRIAEGAAAVDGLFAILAAAVDATGAAADGRFDATDVRAINAWIRANHLEEWVRLHGDQEQPGDVRSGLHLVRVEDTTSTFQGMKLINRVIDAIAHVGFEIVGGVIVNEDGDRNSTPTFIANLLNDFYFDRSSTGTGLDRLTDALLADAGLARSLLPAPLLAGVNAADDLAAGLAAAAQATGALADGRVDAADAAAMAAWIAADPALSAAFAAGSGLAGHGGTTMWFGQSLADAVAPSLFGLADAGSPAMPGIAERLDYFLGTVGTTGTGLDRLVGYMHDDQSLVAKAGAGTIMAGLRAADALNAMILDAAAATGATADGWITADELKAMNGWIRADAGRLATFTALEGTGDGAGGTGFHTIRGDGGEAKLFGMALIDGVADGLYTIGSVIQGGDRFTTDGGAAGQAVLDVALRLNLLLNGHALVEARGVNALVRGTDAPEAIVVRGGAQSIAAAGGDDLVYGGAVRDSIDGGGGDDLIFGGTGQDTLIGGAGDDLLTGGAGRDVFAFRAPGSGHDVVADYVARTDRIDWHGSGAASTADLHFADTAAGTLVTHGADSVLLAGVALASVHMADMLF